MSIIGQIAPFDETIEDFESYCERVSLYFTANDIKEEKKVPVFLTLVGAKIYTLAKNLLSPKDPAKCTINEITNVLNNHFKPKVIVIYERFKFYKRK